MSEALAAATERFVRHLASERRLSTHTCQAYQRDLGQLQAFCLETLAVPHVEHLDKFLLRSWLGRLARDVAPESVARKLSCVRSFLRFLEREGTLHGNPAALLSAPKLAVKLPVFLGVDAAKEVVEAPSALAQREVVAQRDRLILELLYGAGLRVAELVGLNLSSLELSARMLRVVGKGNKERRVPLGKAAAEALLVYLGQRDELRHPKTGQFDAQALLLNQKGHRLGVRGVQKLVRRYGALGAGRGDLHPHSLRHSCATHMLEGGADLRVIQEMLGHSSLSTTQRYTHLSIDQLLRTYDASHPLARARDATQRTPDGQ